MVFASESQRRGFFSKLGQLKEQHRRNVQMKLNEKIVTEQRELQRLQALQGQRLQAERLRLARRKQILEQKRQIKVLKQEEKATKRELRSLTTTGRAVSFVRKEAGIAERGVERAATVTGRGIKKVATSKQTQKALAKIAKGLGI